MLSLITEPEIGGSGSSKPSGLKLQPNELYVNLAGPGRSEDPIPPLSVDLGYGNFIKLSTYNGRNWIAIRKFEGNKALGGITMTLDTIPIIKEALNCCETHIAKCFPSYFKKN